MADHIPDGQVCRKSKSKTLKCATMYYVDRAINVRVPETLAVKIDRLAKAEGMTQS